MANDEFFREMFRGLKQVAYSDHPSAQRLQEYLVSPTRLTPEEWAQASAEQMQLQTHLLICARCAHQVARLRLASLAQMNQRQSTLWETLEARIFRSPLWHIRRLAGYMAVALLIIAGLVLWDMDKLHPTPPSPNPYIIEEGVFSFGGGA